MSAASTQQSRSLILARQDAPDPVLERANNDPRYNTPEHLRQMTALHKLREQRRSGKKGGGVLKKLSVIPTFLHMMLLCALSKLGWFRKSKEEVPKQVS